MESWEREIFDLLEAKEHTIRGTFELAKIILREK